MNDIQYAALTQIATAPLTAAYCHQTYAATSQANGTYKVRTSFSIRIKIVYFIKICNTKIGVRVEYNTMVSIILL